MSKISRRAFVTGGIAAAGVAGLATAGVLAKRYNLVPPDSGGIWGPGETLTYAAQRVITTHAMAREFPRSMISEKPFANSIDPPLGDDFKRHQDIGFADWRLAVDGMVAQPTSFSLADVKKFPQRSEITEVVCEEGWSYVAEWIGTPLHEVLKQCGVSPQARYVVYFSIQPDWWESIDMSDALHPQTLLTYGMNDGELPVGFGGPLRLRVPRQLGYKSVKFITRMTVTDSLKSFGKGLGSAAPETGYAWYAGI